MTAGERTKYFRDLWPAACAAKGWKRSDDDRRRTVVLECMRAVRGPMVTTSDPKFRRDEVTALFCYLEFLANPDDLDRSARWSDCQKDYRAYNRARQADWHEEKLYGSAGSRKLQRNRFAGRRSAQGEPLDAFDPEEIHKRHLTMASRHQKQQRDMREAAVGQDLANHTPAAAVPVETWETARNATEPDPAYVPPADEPF
jgi:hypothetical protein